MAEQKGFFRRIFSFGTSDRPEAERTPEHGQTPIPSDTPQVVTPGAPDADLHSPAAASTDTDTEAGASPHEEGGITPLDPLAGSAEKKTPEPAVGNEHGPDIDDRPGIVEPGAPATNDGAAESEPPRDAEANSDFSWLEEPLPPEGEEEERRIEEPVPADADFVATNDAPTPSVSRESGAETSDDFSWLDEPAAPGDEPKSDFDWLEAPVEEPFRDGEEAAEERIVAGDGGALPGGPASDENRSAPASEDRDEFAWLNAPTALEPEAESPPLTDEDSAAPDRVDVALSPTTDAPLSGVPGLAPMPTPPVAPPPSGEGWRVREAGATTAAPTAATQANWIDRLRTGLSRSSGQLSGQITSLFTKRRLDEATLQDFEDVLIQADLGVETAMRITDRLSEGRFGREIAGTEVRAILAEEIEKTLDPVAMPLELDLSVKPHVILVVGVNGTGKTTTIGKLAAKLTRGGMKVTLAAGDTFRAAAVEQLKIWGERTGSPVIAREIGSDAAGLAFEAYDEAVANGSDVLIVDTAGRLQNKAELMAELEKIVRVLAKRDAGAPHTVLQTLDATTGQNALSQVEIFRNVAGVGGLVMTKLDGTARGGILVAIAAKHKLPVYFVGVGEGIDDLEPFRARDYAQAIAGTAAAG